MEDFIRKRSGETDLKVAWPFCVQGLSFYELVELWRRTYWKLGALAYLKAYWTDEDVVREAGEALKCITQDLEDAQDDLTSFVAMRNSIVAINCIAQS